MIAVTRGPHLRMFGVWARLATLILGLGVGVAPHGALADVCQTRCLDTLSAGCLPSLGAGAMAAIDGQACAGQKAAYRACLLTMVETCDAGPSAAATDPAGWTPTPQSGSQIPAPSPCVLGRWTGWIVEPGFSSYTLELEVGAMNGAAFARSWYPELACGGDGQALQGSMAERVMLSETIRTNRNRCADGRFSLTCLGDGRLLWRWYRNTGQSFDAVLTRP